MKKTLLLLFIPNILIAQNDPVTSCYNISKITDNCYKVEISLKIEKGWHVYSSDQSQDAICLPAKLILKGEILKEDKYLSETGRIHTQDIKVLGIRQYYYEDSLKLSKKFFVGNKKPYHIIVSIEYQVCTEEQCLPVNSKYFHIKLE